MNQAWRRNWMVIYAIALHVCWGLLLLVSPAPLATTALSDWPLSNQYVSAVLILGVGLLALWGMRQDHHARPVASLAAVLPQQFLLMLSAGTALRCAWLGMYGDGTTRAGMHILADQLPAVLAMVLHTGALLDWFRKEDANARAE